MRLRDVPGPSEEYSDVNNHVYSSLNESFDTPHSLIMI